MARISAVTVVQTSVQARPRITMVLPLSRNLPGQELDLPSSSASLRRQSHLPTTSRGAPGTSRGDLLAAPSFAKKQRNRKNKKINAGTKTFDDFRTCDGCATVGWVGIKHKVGTGEFSEGGRKGKGGCVMPKEKRKTCGIFLTKFRRRLLFLRGQD